MFWRIKILLVIIFFSFGHTINAKSFCKTTTLNPIPNNVKYNYPEDIGYKNSDIVFWSSKEGLKRFKNSYNSHFFKLAHHYNPQNYSVSCGIASAVIIINAIYRELGVKMPYHHKKSVGSDKRKLYFGYEKFTEDDFFNEEVDKIRSKEDILGQNNDCKFDFGINGVKQYSEMLNSHKNINSKPFVIDESYDIKKFRQDIKKILSSKNNYIIVMHSGHVSPIVAFDEQTDSLLLLDVAAHLNEWFWIDLKALHKNLLESPKYHGYVIVSPKD